LGGSQALERILGRAWRQVNAEARFRFTSLCEDDRRGAVRRFLNFPDPVSRDMAKPSPQSLQVIASRGCFP
jgi:hypothetical protein